MESISYDRFTSPEAEINNTGQKFIHVSGENLYLFIYLFSVFEINDCKLCFVENIDSKLRTNLPCHLTKKDKHFKYPEKRVKYQILIC